MGIGRPPDFTPLLEIPDLLIMAWGATVPMMAEAVGIELDDITTTWEKWVTPEDRTTVKGVVEAGNVAAIRFTINGVYQGREVITLEHVNRIGHDAAPDWPAGSADDVYRVDIVGSPSISQETAFRFTDGSGRAPAVAGCLSTGLRALNAVPPSTTCPPAGSPRSTCRWCPGSARSGSRSRRSSPGRDRPGLSTDRSRPQVAHDHSRPCRPVRRRPDLLAPPPRSRPRDRGRGPGPALPPSGIRPDLVVRTTSLDHDDARLRVASGRSPSWPACSSTSPLEDDDVYDIEGHDVHYHRFAHRVGTADVLCDQWSWVLAASR